MKVAFLDRDGVINIDHGYVYQQSDFRWVPKALEAMQILSQKGWRIVIVTNQSGIARGYYTEKDLQKLHSWLITELMQSGVNVLDIRFCPHHPSKGHGVYLQNCSCRKPEPGMLTRAAKKHQFALADSIMFGDKPSDMQAGAAAGCKARILLGTNGETTPQPTPESTHTSQSLYHAVTATWFDQL